MAFVRRISIVGDFFCWMWRGGNIREDVVLCPDIGEVREKESVGPLSSLLLCDLTFTRELST